MGLMLYHVVGDKNVVEAFLLASVSKSVLINLLITLVQTVIVEGVCHLFGAVIDLLKLFSVECFFHFDCLLLSCFFFF